MARKKKFINIIILSLLYISASFATDMSEHAIVERIAPVGNVRLSTDKVEKTTPAPSEPRTAQSIYKTFCSVCHSAGIAGAPKIGDKTAWSARLQKGKETLHKHAIQGFNLMPAKGTCMNCSDEEIIKTVDHMLAQQ